jgi:hypothetical protein
MDAKAERKVLAGLVPWSFRSRLRSPLLYLSSKVVCICCGIVVVLFLLCVGGCVGALGRCKCGCCVLFKW